MKTAQRLWLPFVALALGVLIGFGAGKHSPSPNNQLSLSAPSSPVLATEISPQNQMPISSERAPLKIGTQILEDSKGYVARLELNTPEELEQALKRAEVLYASLNELDAKANTIEPLEIVVHGPEVEVFFEENYGRYKPIVDLAARLSAFNIVDVKVCETQIDHLTQEKPTLPPFVEEVPFGPAEVQRLLKNEAYVYF